MGKASKYIPHVFNSFQGFLVKDIKEFSKSKNMEIQLIKEEGRKHLCCRCGNELGSQEGRYFVRARHLRIFDWKVVVAMLLSR